MPVSSPRNSGCRATAWIIEPKIFPMPTPAPRAPSPMPSASAIALPASTPSSAAAKTIAAKLIPSSLVLRLDGRADVDGCQGGEDVGLDSDDDQDLEEVERPRERDCDDREEHVLEHEDQPDEREDQHVAGEHVRVEPDGERYEPHELPEDLQRDDQRVHRLRDVRDPALEVAHRAVRPDPLVVREDEREQREG